MVRKWWCARFLMCKRREKSMIKIVAKELPYAPYPKSSFRLWEAKIDDEEMNKKITEVIDEQGDRQNHSTNVKADMTEWRMWEYPGFKELSDISISIANSIARDYFNRKNVDLGLGNLWGMKYKSNELTVSHDHWPALFSFVYYINPPENASGILFDESDALRKPENGLFVMFEGHTKHQVVPAEFEGHRYAVSGNIYHVGFKKDV